MTLRSFIVAIALCGSSSLLQAGSAQAIPLPDNSTCSSTGNCLSITNTKTFSGGGAITATASTLGAIGVYGANSNGTGVYGYSNSRSGVSGHSETSTGVYGEGTAAGGVGVEGYTNGAIGVYGYNAGSSGNGLVGQNVFSSDAAVAGLAPNDSGLAFWGTGGIIVTGSAQKPGGGMWSNYSDARVKKDVHPLRWGLEELRAVHPVTYKYNGLGGTTDDGHQYVGVIAQELEKILPSMVTSRAGKLRSTDTEQTAIKVVDPSAFTFVLINAVKEQQEIIDRQEHRIAALEHGRRTSLAASMLDGRVCVGLAFGLLPFGFVALRRRKGVHKAV